jgi:glycosyltransferase involved in cell wall biosynthesis
MDKRLNVLWLPAWYPSKIDFLPGDFIDRHAKSVSLFADVVVVFVTKNIKLPNWDKQIEIEKKEGLFIYRGYYNCSCKFALLNKLLSTIFYTQLLFRAYKTARAKHIKFDLVHVHIALYQGLFALYLKWIKGIRYVITEHCSWYMPIGEKYYPKSLITQHVIRVNFKYASALHVVSNDLGNQLLHKFDFLSTFTVIPNTVNTSLFVLKPKNTPALSTNFVAITGNTFHKNTDGLIRAFANYLQNGYSGILHIAGPNIDELEILAKNLVISDFVKLLGPISNEAVAQLIQEADALVFFSRYETFGCVMAEALCCGKPVIASKLQVLTEHLKEKENAIFVESENEDDLTQKLILFTQQKMTFKHKQIAIAAKEKFNPPKIGREFLALYNSILNN